MAAAYGGLYETYVGFKNTGGRINRDILLHPGARDYFIYTEARKEAGGALKSVNLEGKRKYQGLRAWRQRYRVAFTKRNRTEKLPIPERARRLQRRVWSDATCAAHWGH